MNRIAKIAAIGICAVICAIGVIFSESPDRQVFAAIDDSLGESGLPNDYRLAVSDGPLKLSLNQIEKIIRHDPKTRELRGRMDFGSVKVQRGGVVAEVVLRDKFYYQKFVCVLKHSESGWYVADLSLPLNPRTSKTLRV